MKQKKFNPLILAIIIYIVWSVIAILFGYYIDQKGKSDIQKLFEIFQVLVYIVYIPIFFFPIIIALIHMHNKNIGEGRPLSIRAMRESKRHLPNKIYKFCSLSPKSENQQLNNSKLKTLENNEIWLSRCVDLNDPFEGMRFAFPEKTYLQNGLPDYIKRRINIETIEEFIKFLSETEENYCQSSFSSDFKDIKMWGYYASGGRGYCVEYEVMDKTLLFPVFYVNKRIILNGSFENKKYEMLCEKNLRQIDKSLRYLTYNEYIQYNLYIQSFKYSKWASEKEIRVIDINPSFKGGSQSAHNYGLKPTKIIVGHSSEYIEELKSIAEKLNLSFSIMEPDFETNIYKLIEHKIF